MNMRRKIMNKKGQLFIIEAFIAVSVMIIMVTALYEVRIATQPPIVPSYNVELYEVMTTLDTNGQLNEFLIALNSGTAQDIASIKAIIEQAISGALPDNGRFTLYCENLATEEIIASSWINEGYTPIGESMGIDYLLVSRNGDYAPHQIHVKYWLIGV
jgi:hypothetical protein